MHLNFLSMRHLVILLEVFPIIFKQEGFVISGDALFKGSIGRTDLPGGNQSQLIKSIHEKLLFLPEETLVLPGHGPTTTIGEEMDSNPLFKWF